MKTKAIIFALLFLAAVCRAQDYRQGADSVCTVLPTLSEMMPSCVEIRQSPLIESAFRRYREYNLDKQFSGYRIRIYYGSGQNARNASQECMDKFNLIHPDITSYREYENPYFRVTVGDYRTKIDAERALDSLRHDFTGSIVIRQKMRFPTL